MLRSISIGERQEGDFFIERAEALEAADIVGDFIQILFYEGVAKTFMLMMSFIQNAESVDRVIHVIAALYKMKARDAFWKLMNGFASKIKEDKLPQYLSLVSLTFDNESVPIDKIANAMKQAADAPDTVIAFFRAFK